MMTRFFFSEEIRKRQLTEAQKDFLQKLIEVFTNFSEKIRGTSKAKIVDEDIRNVSVLTGEFQKNIISGRLIVRRKNEGNTEFYYYVSEKNYINVEIENGEVVDIRIIQRTNEIMSGVWDVSIRVHMAKNGKYGISTPEEDNENIYIVQEIDKDESWYDDFIFEMTDF